MTRQPLTVVGFSFYEPSIPDLPGWVRDLSIQYQPGRFPKRSARKSGPMYDVSSTAGNVTASLVISPEFNKLVAKGFEFDSVMTVTEPRTTISASIPASIPTSATVE
jgi:hypothetical protein